jgi:TonB family protein
MTDEARAKYVKGTVSLTVVFCQTGRVTDIKVVKGLPYGMTERVLAAIRDLKFKPAEKDGQEVSQRQRIAYNFNIY